MMHANRGRAESFGAVAERYDRARPRYPAAMLDDLVAGGTPDVLDVGCGTGIAGAEFAARGCAVLGVEPDERMAAVARAKGLAVEVATFETWDAAGRAFDLVVSGQAWHWVDPDAGPAKAASVLRPGGRLATFWNLGAHPRALRAALDAVYERHAPELLRDSVATGRLRREPSDSEGAAIAASGAFGPVEVRDYEWTTEYTTAQWIEVLRTYSDHALLPDGVRGALLADLGVALDAAGGSFVMEYRTRLVTALRSAA